MALTKLRKVNGPAVRAIREALGIRLSDFATRVDSSPGYICNIEAGRKEPSHATAAAIARELGVPIDAITYPACACEHHQAVA